MVINMNNHDIEKEIQDKKLTEALEKLDVRAYHVLVEELTHLMP